MALPLRVRGGDRGTPRHRIARGNLRGRPSRLPFRRTLLALAAAASLHPAALPAQVVATIRVAVRGVAAAAPAARDAPAPLPAALVTAPGTGLAAFTDARGEAVLEGLPPGRHRLLVTAAGFAEAAIEVLAVNGRVTRAQVLLLLDPVAIAGLRVRAASRSGGGGGTMVETATLPPGVADLAGALDRLPGVTVVREGGPGARATVQVRGSGDDQVLVLLDGTPINSPLDGVADLSTVELGALRRIAVLPGAQSARYGPRALGGVVLLESRDGGEATGAAAVGIGAWSDAEMAASGSWPLGGRWGGVGGWGGGGVARPEPESEPEEARAAGAVWTISGGGRWRRSTGDFRYEAPPFRGGGERRRENAAARRMGGELRIVRRGRVQTSLRAEIGDSERGSPGSIAQPSLSGRQEHRRYGLSAVIEPAIASSALVLPLAPTSQPPRFGGSARATLQWQRAAYTDPTPPFGRPWNNRTRVRRAELALEGWRGAAAAAAPLRFGLHAARLDLSSNALVPSALALDELGAWARVAHGWFLGRGSHLGLAAAVRADRHELVPGTTSSPSIDATLERAGLALGLRWARGFAPPGLTDLFFREGVLAEPNPHLRPERTRGDLSLSVAHRWILGSVTGELRAAAYRADIDDMILWQPDHRFVWHPGNHDVARRGLEAGATLALARSGTAAEHTLAAHAAWSQVTYTGAVLTGQVAYRPRFAADLALGVALPGAAHLTATAHHIGERRTAPGTPQNALPPYTLLGAGLGLPVPLAGRAAELDLALTNLLDARAALLADYPLPGRAWSVRLEIEAGR